VEREERRGMLRIDLKYIFGNYFDRDNFSKDIE
jgi:hypothetical protein